MIELKNYEKWYGKFEAVKPTSLTVEEGEIFVLLGPNGSGKSTIIRSIVGLLKPTKGEILLDGNNTWTAGKKVRSMISYMPQRITMPDHLKAKEIIKFYADLRDEPETKVAEVLDLARLNGHSDRFVREFSGGLLQRLGLAVAFLNDSPVIIMDEPTLNLDPRGMKQFRQFILDKKESGTTILFASHILADAELLADRVGIMVNGELVRVESVDKLRNEIQKRSTVIIRITQQLEKFPKIATDAGATSARYENGYLRFVADPAKRLSVLQRLQTAGAEIDRFATEGPKLEELIMEHFGEDQ